MGKLDNKVAIVTGASRGIGESCSIHLAKEGAKVIVASRNYSECEKVVEKIKQLGSDAIPFSVNITDFEKTKSMADFVVGKYGKVDILVNNAGITDDAFFENMSCGQWLNVINTNLNGTFFAQRRWLDI